MNSSEIQSLLRSDKFVDGYLVGVFAADQLPTVEFPGAYIVNTDEHTQPGQHWVAFFSIDNKIECFDSFGKHPGEYSPHIQKWLKKYYNIVQCETLQSTDSTVCGQYCMFFILLRSYGYSYEDVMSCLTKRSEINDKFVCKFVNKFFKIRKGVQDKYFLIQNALNGKF